MKRLFLPLLGFLSLVLMCCNDNKESGTDSYDPNKPVTIDIFYAGHLSGSRESDYYR